MPIDRREDAGDFYPGGKVISTRPVATGGDVRHAEFADVRVETNTMPALRSAVRSLAAKLGATVVSAFAVCAAFAATVQTVPVNDLDFDANPSVVTNVTFEGLAQEGEVESIRVEIASNRVEIASNRVEIASNRVEIASNADSISTLSNSIPTTTSNIVTKAYVEDLGISADFSTNNTVLVETIETVAPAPGNYAAVSNRAMSAVQSQSMTNYATRAELEAGWWSEWEFVGVPEGYTVAPTTPQYRPEQKEGDWLLVLYDSVHMPDEFFATGDAEATSLQFSNPEGDLPDVTITATRHRVAAPVPTKPSDIGAASTNDVQLTPVYSDTPTFSEWTSDDGLSHTIRWNGSTWEVVGEGGFDPPECYDFYATSISTQDLGFTATRTRTDIIGYTLGSQSDKPLQPQGDYPTKAEAASPGIVTNIVRDLSLGGIWDETLEVWWTPRMRNGSLTYEATTNVNLNAEN